VLMTFDLEYFKTFKPSGLKAHTHTFRWPGSHQWVLDVLDFCGIGEFSW
jgi:hypothetical protein